MRFSETEPEISIRGFTVQNVVYQTSVMTSCLRRLAYVLYISQSLDVYCLRQGCSQQQVRQLNNFARWHVTLYLMSCTGDRIYRRLHVAERLGNGPLNAK